MTFDKKRHRYFQVINCCNASQQKEKESSYNILSSLFASIYDRVKQEIILILQVWYGKKSWMEIKDNFQKNFTTLFPTSTNFKKG